MLVDIQFLRVPFTATTLRHGCAHPDSKAHEANMGPTWVLSAPERCWPHEPCYQGSASLTFVTVVILLWPNGIIWHREYQSPFAQACCSMPSHYLNQYWLVKFESTYNTYSEKKCIWKCSLQNVSHTAQASMCYLSCESMQIRYSHL